jgi:hypothetical protein
MSFNAKEAAEKLFEIADVIEKQASQATFFVCEGCNHTSNLETINSVRARYASENNAEVTSNVSVDDTISCKACGGDMKYAATEESEKFFVEAASKKSEDESEEEPVDDFSEEEVSEEPADEETTEEPADEEVSEDPAEEPAEDKKEKRTTKDKEDTDGKVEVKDEPKAQFGEDDKKSSKTAFDTAVNRYSNF